MNAQKGPAGRLYSLSARLPSQAQRWHPPLSGSDRSVRGAPLPLQFVERAALVLMVDVLKEHDLAARLARARSISEVEDALLEVDDILRQFPSEKRDRLLRRYHRLSGGLEGAGR